jgi:hypothetical protein
MTVSWCKSSVSENPSRFNVTHSVPSPPSSLQYFNCFGGTPVGGIIYCKSGNLFDVSTQYCNWAEKVECIFDDCQTTPPTPSPTSTPTTATPTGAPSSSPTYPPPPTAAPTTMPSPAPSPMPTSNPTLLPTTEVRPTDFPTLGDPGATSAPTTPETLAPQTNSPTILVPPTMLVPPTQDPKTVVPTESPTRSPHNPTISPSSSTSEPTFYPMPRFGPSLPPTRPGIGSQSESGITPSGFAPFTSGTFSAGVTVASVSKVCACVLLFLAINV